MANLVPLNIDKDTGDIVARGGAVQSQAGRGFLYEQLAPSGIWTISHNEDTDKLLAQVYDDSGEFTFPDEILIVDTNTVEITFNDPMTGTAHLIFFTSSQ